MYNRSKLFERDEGGRIEMQPCTVEKLTGVRKLFFFSAQQLKRARARFSKLARVCAQLDRPAACLQ